MCSFFSKKRKEKKLNSQNKLRNEFRTLYPALIIQIRMSDLHFYCRSYIIIIYFQNSRNTSQAKRLNSTQKRGKKKNNVTGLNPLHTKPF